MYTDRFRYKFMYLSQSTQIKMIFSHKIYIEWCSSKPLLFVYKNRGLYKFYKFDIYFMSKKSVIQSDLEVFQKQSYLLYCYFDIE